MKLTGPMLSVRAAGSFGNTLTYAENQSGPIGRFRALPADPRSQKQLAYRSAMRMLSLAWATINDAYQASWDNEPLAIAYSNYHAYCAYNLIRFRSSLGLTQRSPPDGYEATATADPPYAEAIDGRAVITLPNVIHNTEWGIYLWRDDSTNVPHDYEHCLGVYDFQHDGTYRFTDIPPQPGTWYYHLQGFRPRGANGKDHGEVDVTI